MTSRPTPARPTPVFHETTTAAAARSYVRRQMPNLEADATFNAATRRWTPTCRLRSDQLYLKDRLEERGVKCVLPDGPSVTVSAAMADAGADALYTASRLGLDGRDTVKMIYEAMSKER